jgi:hypothetical protein
MIASHALRFGKWNEPPHHRRLLRGGGRWRTDNADGRIRGD